VVPGVERSQLRPPLPERPRLLHLGLLAPALRGGLVDLFVPAGQDFVGEFQVEEFQLLDLVAQAAGFLELQVGRGRPLSS
jgi:hypothetical protein